MTDKRLFLAGLAAGALGGLLVAGLTAKRDREPRRLPHLEVSQRVLAETRGAVRAALLTAQVQARYDGLVANRPRFDQPALRKHLESSILPGLALYQTLRAEHDDQAVVLAEMDRLFAAWAEHSGRRKQLQLLERLPDPFAVLRIANRLALKAASRRRGGGSSYWKIATAASPMTSTNAFT